jgi:hypothetical protein
MDPFNDQHCCSFKMATMAAILDLVSIDYLDECLIRLVRFFGGILGVTGERFLSVTWAAAHSRWLPLQPSILDLVSVDYLTNAESTGYLHLV